MKVETMSTECILERVERAMSEQESEAASLEASAASFGDIQNHESIPMESPNSPQSLEPCAEDSTEDSSPLNKKLKQKLLEQQNRNANENGSWRKKGPREKIKTLAASGQTSRRSGR